MSDRMYTAEVIADSISPEGRRITTVKAVYPHAIHKDMLRHRNQNRNVESFRAQPPEILIENLRSGHAFMPDVFAARTKGMGQGQSVGDTEQQWARDIWEEHINDTCERAELFLGMGIAKQQVNFLLQDLCPLTEIITATDWSNFFALRTELNEDGTPVARPEVYKTVCAIRDAILGSTPFKLDYGMIHLPFVSESELALLCSYRGGDLEKLAKEEDFWIKVSAGRCARISYGDYDWETEDPTKSAVRALELLSKGHMSPFEQQARPFSKMRWQVVAGIQDEIPFAIPGFEAEDMIRQLEYSGNLRGWIPARKMFPNEYDYSLIKGWNMK